MSLSQFLQDLINENLSKIEQGFIAKIVSFDKETMRAEIEPLLEFTTEISGTAKTVKAPNIKDVPCEIIYAGGYYVRPVYQKDDLVNCQLKSSNINKPIDADIRADSQNNRFSLSYCTVTGGVLPKDFTSPEEWGSRDGLLIGFGDNEVIEVLEGTIKIDATEIHLNGDGDTAVKYSELETAFNQLKDDFDNFVSTYNAHTHTTTATVGVGPVGVIAPTTSTGSPSTADITPAEEDSIKLGA